MQKASIFLPFIIAASQLSCVQTNPIEVAMASTAEQIARVQKDLAEHEVQVLFSEINRDSDGIPTLSNAEFQVSDNQYFYPASTVKFPIALLALEKLAEDPRLNRDTPFMVAGDTVRTTFAEEIVELFVVSDNDAYNRLFEYIGKDEINLRLREKGVDARISHRLSVSNSDALSYKPLTFYTEQGEVQLTAKESEPIAVLPLAGLIKGQAYQQNGGIINEAFNFSEKNYLPLRSLHSITQRLFFPELFESQEQFRLSESDRNFVLETMKTLPAAAGYNDEEYYDSYVKFFLFGDSKAAIPSHIEIYNKVGYAYGTLTDSAYIVDRKRNKEYIISATVLVNENGTFNDDDYEYETIGIPFLAELGRQLVNFEL